MLGRGVEFLCTQESYQCSASPMRGRNREEKATRNPNSQAGEVDMACQYFASNITRSYWKRGKSEILWGRKISHCEKVFANSFWNTTSAIVAGLELVQDKSAWRKGRLRLLLLSKLSSHIWLLSILFAEWDTSDISLVEYQLYTSTNFLFLCSSTVWICAHCQQDLRSAQCTESQQDFLVKQVNCYRL